MKSNIAKKHQCETPTGCAPFVRKGNALLTGLLSFLFAFSAAGQTTISTSKFLSTALGEQRILLQQKKLEFLKKTNFDMPWADELEFRTETDEMDLSRQEYLMRFRYNAKGERAAQNKIHLSNIQLEETEKMLILEKSLLDKYFLTLKYMALFQEIKIVKEQQLVALDKITVLRRKALASTDDFEINDLLKAEENAQYLEQELLGLENDFDFLKSLIKTGLDISGEIELDTAGLISIEELKAKMKQLPKNPTANHNLFKRKLNIEQSALEYDLEKAKNDWKLNYVQFKYAGRDKLNYGEEWSFGLGMEIPLKDAGRMDRNEYVLGRMALENRLLLQDASLTKRLQRTYQEIESKIQQHELANRQLADSQLLYSFENYPQYKDADPLVILNIKSSLLKRQINKIKIEKDIYSLYLKIIELTGKTAEMPLRNYLSGGWELIEN